MPLVQPTVMGFFQIQSKLFASEHVRICPEFPLTLLAAETVELGSCNNFNGSKPAFHEHRFTRDRGQVVRG